VASCAFRLGDVVKLRSGGPTMTVHQIDNLADGAVECVWMTPDGAFFRVALPTECLELVSQAA
jgi:uncharacterized protein YodC (DUF2158 family)